MGLDSYADDGLGPKIEGTLAPRNGDFGPTTCHDRSDLNHMVFLIKNSRV